MNLYLLRHGIATDPGMPGVGKDAERPLTSEGEHKLRKSVGAFRELDLCFDLILSSPYLRARRTAEIVAEALRARKQLEFSDTLAPSGSAKKLIDVLKHRAPPAEEVLLVGHEPYLSELISLLVSGVAGTSITMKKGGLCKLAAPSLQYGRCATLEWLLTPRQLALMA